MLNLHRASPADVADIRALVRTAYAPWVPVIGREPLPMWADYDAALAPPLNDQERIAAHIIDLHRVDGTLVAMIDMQPVADALLIVNVAVAPSHQGRGLGRSLLAHAEAVATTLGFDRLRLYTNALMTTNVRLYQQVGYRVDREERWKGGTIVHMLKSIRAG